METTGEVLVTDLINQTSLLAVLFGGVFAGLVVGAQTLQQQRGAFRDVMHQRLAVALHVALSLFKGQAPDVSERFLVILVFGIVI